jgi:integrase
MSIIKPRGRFAAAEVIDQSRNHLEPGELASLFHALDDDPFWYAYFRFQYFYGCRVSEVAILLKEDVSFEANQVVVRRLKKKQFATEATIWKCRKCKATGKLHRQQRVCSQCGGAITTTGGEKRKVGEGFSEHVYGLTPRLIQILQRVPPLVPKENPWFFGSAVKARVQGKERMAQIRQLEGGWRSVSRSLADLKFREAAVAAGLPRRLAHTHVLRHTRATLLLANGAKEENVQFLLGHSHIDITRRYLGQAEALRLRAQTEGRLGDLDEEAA